MRSEIVRMRPDEKTTLALRKLIEDTQLDGIVMVEVGSYAGESAEAFVSTGKVKTIYCVDPWLPGYDKKDIASDTDFNMVESAFDEVQSRHKDTIVKFKGVLKDFAQQHPNLRPDLIYIDACHTYEACKDDISTALSMSPKFVSGHDYVKGWSGVMKAVDEMFGKPGATYEDESWMVDLTKERGCGQMNVGIVTIWSPLEIPYMKEWVEHHKSLGVAQFIVALNDWTAFDMVEFNHMFWREINDKTIHPIRINGSPMQLPAYNQGINLASSLGVDWCAFIDADEFIKIRSDRTLESILADYHDYPQLSLNWRLYGSSGIMDIQRDENGNPTPDAYNVLSRFTKCERVLNRHVKQMVNIEWFRTRDAMLPHFMLPHNTDSASKGLMGEMVIGPWNQWKLDQPREIELAHYATKSRAEFMTRRNYRRADTGKPRENLEDMWLEHDKNDIDESELKMG